MIDKLHSDKEHDQTQDKIFHPGLESNLLSLAYQTRSVTTKPTQAFIYIYIYIGDLSLNFIYNLI